MNFWVRIRDLCRLRRPVIDQKSASSLSIEHLENRALLSGAGADFSLLFSGVLEHPSSLSDAFEATSRLHLSSSSQAAARALPKMSEEYGNPVRGSDGALNKAGGDGNPRTGRDNGTADGRCGGLRKKKKDGKDYYYPHEGIDIAAKQGKAVLAARGGKVITSETQWNKINPTTGKKRSAALGNYVVIKHEDGTLTRYAHLNGRSQIPNGTQVAKGQVIGQVGVTGNAGGNRASHLHFEAIGTNKRWECPFIEPGPGFNDLVAEPWKNPKTGKQVWTKPAVDALKRQYQQRQAANPDPGGGGDGDGEEPPPEPPKYVACYFDTSSENVNDWIWRCHVTTSSSNPPPYLTSPFPGPCGEPDPNFVCEGVFA